MRTRVAPCGMRRGLRQGLFALLMAAPIVAAAAPALAQQPKYPDRAVRIVVPFNAGGATDVIARILSVPLGEVLGQSIVIENRAGAGGNLGAAVVARAEPDGYTLLLASSGVIASPALYKTLTYDVFKDLAPIAEVATSTNIIVADPKSSIKSLADMIAQAKASPGKLNYASPGTGTTPQLAMELLKLRAGVNITHVVYTGAAPAMQAIMAGTLELGSMALSNIHAQVKAGTLRGLAVTGTERWHDLPDIPTVEQSGFPDFDFETVFILFAPTGTSPDIIARLSKEVIAILGRPEVRDRMQNAGLAVLARGPDALKARLAREVPIYKDIVARAGIPVN
jgi:tripartite-type tricarboxylate transporter receptor subunit TctC